MSFSDKLISLGGASGFGGAWLWSERIGGEVVAAVMVMAGLGLFAALAWRAELWSPKSSIRNLASAAPRREKVAAPVVALLLLSTAVGSPAVGVAAAASSTEECKGVDAIVYDMVTIGEYSLADQEEHPCSPKYQRAQAIEELKNDSATQEKQDIYNAALEQQANTETFTDVQSNYLNDSRSVAWMHAETAIANAYANGSSKAVAKSKAKQAVQDYYATKQVNMIERWNVTVAATATLRKTAENQSGINSRYVRVDSPTHSHDGHTDQPWIKDVNATTTVSLVNASSHGVKAIVVDENHEDCGPECWGNQEYYYTLASGVSTNEQNTAYNIEVMPPNSDYEKVEYLHFAEYKTRWDRVETLNSDLQNEVDPFVNATWTAFQNDEINASDVISRNNLMFRYGTDALNNSNQSLYDSTAALSTMGVATPNINSTGSMTVIYRNVSYTGMVLAQEAPNGTWETNTTYNTENIGGVVMLATTEGERIDMEGNFTLQEMKNQDGDQINQTSATKVVYRTSNTSEVLDKMERILELRAQIEATKPKAGGGGTTSDGSSLLDRLAAFLGVSVGAAAAVLVGVGVLAFKIYSP